MLDFMRRRTRSVGIKIIFGVIALVFVFWGVGGNPGDTTPLDAVATVDDQQISARQFQRAYENVRASYQNMYKDQWSADLEKSLNLKQQTLQQLIDMQLMNAEAQRIGLTVSDDEIRDSITGLPAFQAYGSFSPERYRRVLRSFRMTPREFEDDQRTQLLTQKLRDFILSTVSVSDDEARSLFQTRQEKVNLEFLKIASADLIDAVKVAPSDLTAYYDTHRESFRQPERVRFSYASYPAEHFAPEITIADHDLEAFYTEHKAARFTTPERVQARHILFSSDPNDSAEDKAEVRKEASALLEKVRAGEDFATLATDHSADTASAANGGDLGFFSRGRMVKPFEDEAFRLGVGEVSDLVETQFGYHIIKVEAKEPETVRPLEEVKEEIRNTLTDKLAGERAQTAAQEDSDKIQAGALLSDVVEERGLKVEESPLVGRDETIPDLGRQPQVMKAAFDTDLNTISSPVTVNETTYLILPTEKQASQIPDFETMKDEVEGRYRSEQAEQLAKEKAEALLARVTDSKSFDPIMKEQEAQEETEEKKALEVEETGLFTRQGGYIPKIGSLPELKKAAFRATEDNPVIPDVYLWGGNAFVAILQEAVSPDSAEFEEQKKTLRQELLSRKQASAGRALLDYLKKRASIETRPDALAQLS